MINVNTVTVHRVRGRELDKAIAEDSGHEFEMTHEYVQSDDDSMSLERDIDPDEYENAQAEWETFCESGDAGNPCTIIEAYLTKLCYEGKIPAGSYHIEW